MEQWKSLNLELGRAVCTFEVGSGWAQADNHLRCWGQARSAWRRAYLMEQKNVTLPYSLSEYWNLKQDPFMSRSTRENASVQHILEFYAVAKTRFSREMRKKFSSCLNETRRRVSPTSGNSGAPTALQGVPLAVSATRATA